MHISFPTLLRAFATLVYLFKLLLMHPVHFGPMSNTSPDQVELISLHPKCIFGHVYLVPTGVGNEF